MKKVKNPIKLGVVGLGHTLENSTNFLGLSFAWNVLPVG